MPEIIAPMANGHSNGIHGLIGEVVPPSRDSFEKEINWNYFSILISKLGIIPDLNSKLSTFQQAEEAIDKLISDKAKATEEVIRLNDLNHSLKQEVADIKIQYAQVASHNAKIHESESAAVVDGMEKEKVLNDVVSVLPFSPEEVTKKSIWKGIRAFRLPYEKQIKDLEKRLKQAEKEHIMVTEPRRPWWSWLPGGDRL